MKTVICLLLTTTFLTVNSYSQKSDQIFTVVIANSNIRHLPNTEAPIIGKLLKGDTVEIKGFMSNFYLIKKESLYGYVYENNIEKTPAVAVFIADYVDRAKNLEEVRKRNIEQAKKEMRLKLDPNEVDLYGEVIAERIYNYEIWIGMTPEMARKSLKAYPDRINTSSYLDQYVFDTPKFGYKYLYFNPKENSLVSGQEEK